MWCSGDTMMQHLLWFGLFWDDYTNKTLHWHTVFSGQLKQNQNI